MTRSMFGHLRWLSNDRYRVYWEEGVKTDGSRKQRSKNIRGTRDDAEIFLAKKRLDRGNHFDVGDVTIGEYWETWYKPQLYALHGAGEGMSLGTIKNYESLWRAHLKKDFTGDVMQDMTMRGIDRKLLQIEGAYPRFQSMKLLRQMFNQAWNEDLLEANPFLKKTKISEPRKREQDVLKSSELMMWVRGMHGFMHEAVHIHPCFWWIKARGSGTTHMGQRCNPHR